MTSKFKLYIVFVLALKFNCPFYAAENLSIFDNEIIQVNNVRQVFQKFLKQNNDPKELNEIQKKQFLNLIDLLNPASQYFLGTLCEENSYGFRGKDKTEWYSKASKQRFSLAQYKKGLKYSKKPNKRFRAFKYFNLAAASENPEALLRLGMMYDLGIETKQDKSLAIQSYHKAAFKGNHEAEYELALKYQNGIDVEKNISLALRYYTLASEGGHCNATNNLGHLYYYGLDVPEDKDRGYKLLEKSIDQGNYVEAYFGLGLIHLKNIQNGEGDLNDLLSAEFYLKKACKKGFIYALKLLSLFYSMDSCKKDLELAKEYSDKFMVGIVINDLWKEFII